jgi:Neuraminidase (sialidase)
MLPCFQALQTLYPESQLLSRMSPIHASSLLIGICSSHIEPACESIIIFNKLNSPLRRAGLGSEMLYIYSSETGKYTLMGTYLEGVENNPYTNGLDYRNSRIHVTWTYRDFVPFEGWDKSTGTNHKQQAGPNGIENNHDLWYSYSDDLGRSWKNNSGQTIAKLDKGESVRPNNDGIKVFEIPKGSGVHNQEDQAIDYDGGVHVLNRDTTSGHMEWKHYYRSPSGMSKPS